MIPQHLLQHADHGAALSLLVARSCVGLQSSDTSLCHVLGCPGEQLHFGDCLRLLCSPCPRPLAAFCSANTWEGAT